MLDNTRITTKINVIIALMAILGISSLLFMAWQMVKIADAYSDQIERLDVATVGNARTNRHLVNYGRAAYRLAVESTPEGNREFKAELLLIKSTLQQEMDAVHKLLPEYAGQVDAVAAATLKTFAACQGAIDAAERNATPQEVVRATARLKEECDPALNQAIAKTAETTDFLIREARQNSVSLTERTWASVRLSIFLMVSGLGAVLALGMFIARRGIIAPLEQLRRVTDSYGQKQFEQPTPGTQRKDELGAMARVIEFLRVEAIKMAAEGWQKRHVADIGAALQGAEDLQTLAQTVVSQLAPVIGAGHAGFYVADAEQCYQLLGSYGYRERRHLNNSFRIGEGLVGQCAMEKSAIMLTAPKDYIRINSGLGEGPPACISVMPVIRGERVLGVLEMASFQVYSERERSLMAALLPVVATNMEILDRNLKTRELLKATQEQAERMEKQAAQLEEQTVEMEAQQAELLETENWFRSIIETAPYGMLVADVHGRILLSNPNAEQMFGYGPGEMLDGSIEALVPETYRPGHAAQRIAFMAEGRNRLMGSGRQVKGLRKDGSQFPIAVSLNLLPTRGDRGRCVSVAVRALS